MTTYAFRDDGQGAIPGLSSTVSYAAGTVSVKPQAEFSAPSPTWRRDDEAKRFVFDGWTYSTLAASLPTSETLTVAYAYGDALAAVQEVFTGSSLVVDVTPAAQEEIIPASLRLELGGKTYLDQIGGIYADVDAATGAGTFSGTFSGTMDNTTGLVALTAWTAGAANAPTLLSLATRLGSEAVDQVTFRAPGAPVQVGSVQINAVDTEGAVITATADGTGAIAATGIEGQFYYQAGVGQVRFGDWVAAAGNETQPWYSAGAVVNGQIFKPRWALASSIRFNCVTTSYLPIDSEVLGLNSEGLPENGKVPAFRAGDLVAIHHTHTTIVASPTGGTTVDTGRAGLERIWVRDTNGVRVPKDRYSVDLDAGLLTWAQPLDLAGYVGPFTVYDRIMHKCRLATVDISGRLGLRLPLNHTFQAGSLVSSALWIGDMQARIERIFSQQVWQAGADGSFWANARIGSEIVAKYNNVQFPILVTNRSTKDRYALIFESGTAYRVVSEKRGVLATGIPINVDYTLDNPLTGADEFTIYAAGFGSGWVGSNVLRFDVIGGSFPWELGLSIQEGVPTVDLDHLTLEFMGDI